MSEHPPPIGYPPPVERVDLAPGVDVSTVITAQIIKRCPFKDEIDNGIVEISYRAAGSTWELHSLRSFLDEFAHRPVSHENLTWALSLTFRADVTTRWQTGGMEVCCRAVFRESDDRAGA